VRVRAKVGWVERGSSSARVWEKEQKKKELEEGCGQATLSQRTAAWEPLRAGRKNVKKQEHKNRKSLIPMGIFSGPQTLREMFPIAR